VERIVLDSFAQRSGALAGALLKPELILIENVPGLRRGVAPGDVFNKFHEALGELGYHLSPSVIDCQAYGVPQRRRRLVIMASLLGPVALPTPTASSLPPGRGEHRGDLVIRSRKERMLRYDLLPRTTLCVDSRAWVLPKPVSVRGRLGWCRLNWHTGHQPRSTVLPHKADRFLR
jgi:site-specific DNA-cytosine methylase